MPLLIPPDAKQALEFLVAKYNDAGMHADNPFVFAKVSICTAGNYIDYINSPMLLLFLFNDPLGNQLSQNVFGNLHQKFRIGRHMGGDGSPSHTFCDHSRDVAMVIPVAFHNGLEDRDADVKNL